MPLAAAPYRESGLVLWHISEVVRLSARVRYWGQNGLCQTLPTSHGVKVAILQRMVRKRFDRAANSAVASTLLEDGLAEIIPIEPAILPGVRR